MYEDNPPFSFRNARCVSTKQLQCLVLAGNINVGQHKRMHSRFIRLNAVVFSNGTMLSVTRIQ